MAANEPSDIMGRLYDFFAQGRMVNPDFETLVQEHGRLLRRRSAGGDVFKFVRATETDTPVGQAALWHSEMSQYMPPSAVRVGKQIARLCGEDSHVTLPWRSLSDDVGHRDRAGREVAYTQRGVQALVDGGWLRKETVGTKRGARTTFYLTVGDFIEIAERVYESEFLEHEDAA